MAPDLSPTGAPASSRGYKALNRPPQAAPFPAPAQSLVREHLHPSAPDRSTSQPAPHLHPTPSHLDPGPETPAALRQEGRKGAAARGSRGPARRVREPGERSGRPSGGSRRPGHEASRPHPRPRAQSPRASPRPRAASARPARACVRPRSRSRPRCGPHLRGGRPDSFRPSVEAQGRWVRSLPIPVPWRYPDPRAVQGAAAAGRPLPAESDIRAACLSRRCGARSEASASLAGPGPESRLSPRIYPRGT